MFADAEELKDQILEDLIAKQVDVTAYYSTTGMFPSLARSQAFEALSLAMVCLNSLWIAVDIDWNDSVVLVCSDPAFQVIAHLFCAFFVFELLTRFLAFKKKRDVLKEPWFVFDAVLLFLIVFETWIITALLLATGSALNTGNFRVLGVFRILRLVRVLRVARVMRELPELLVIIRGISIAFRGIVVVLALLGFVIYMAAIVFRVLLEGTEIGAARFGSVATAMGTLLLDAALPGSKGAPIIHEAYLEGPLYAALVLLFVLLANVTVMGVLGGLLVQTVKTVAEVEKEERAVKGLQRTMQELWELALELDEDEGAVVTALELQRLLSGRGAGRLLQGIGVDLEGLASTVGFIFEQHEGRLTKTQFKRMLLDLRGKNAAKVKDHVETRKFVHAQLKHLCMARPGGASSGG